MPDGTTCADSPRLQLLDRFELRVHGEVCPLPTHAQRVLAFLALQGRQQVRSTLAERLWLEMPSHRPQANLRTALWRIRQADRALVAADHVSVGLDPDVVVDVDVTIAHSRLLLSGADAVGAGDLDVALLRGELLPGWDEDWITLTRERVRQLRLHALEALCERLASLGRYPEAIEAGQEAVAGEPLRESAHVALIRAHLAEGNSAEARRQFFLYERLVRDELGIQPSPALRGLVAAMVDLDADRPR
jgi:DNA-binding SARP family transcriptional activator